MSKSRLVGRLRLADALGAADADAGDSGQGSLSLGTCKQ